MNFICHAISEEMDGNRIGVPNFCKSVSKLTKKSDQLTTSKIILLFLLSIKNRQIIKTIKSSLCAVFFRGIMRQFCLGSGF